MDAFESLVSGLLRKEGYWTEIGYKVELTKEDKRRIGRACLSSLNFQKDHWDEMLQM